MYKNGNRLIIYKIENRDEKQNKNDKSFVLYSMCLSSTLWFCCMYDLIWPICTVINA